MTAPDCYPIAAGDDAEGSSGLMEEEGSSNFIPEDGSHGLEGHPMVTVLAYSNPIPPTCVEIQITLSPHTTRLELRI